jgi:hypothetical protein
LWSSFFFFFSIDIDQHYTNIGQTKRGAILFAPLTSACQSFGLCFGCAPLHIALFLPNIINIKPLLRT